MKYTRHTDFTLLFNDVQLFDEKNGASPGGTMAVVSSGSVSVRDLGARFCLSYTKDQLGPLIEILKAVKAEIEKESQAGA